ncbi:mucin-4-like [Antedon mediterranea]|uniref:mucin-4-like n=1 Tax=Antedon mediterranea TaxID=105859 RepID=UPI003AF63900
MTDRYKPDFENGNTGLKGRWIFRSERNSNATVNPKMECQSWYSKQPDPVHWTYKLGSCPCGYDQGKQDVKFSPFNNTVSWNGQAITGNYSDKFICIRTTLENIYGAGLQCCYREDLSLIEGFYDVQISSFMLQHQPSDSEGYSTYLNEDVIPRYYCCDASMDQSFCDMYIEKRPIGKCDGYIPPKTGMS